MRIIALALATLMTTTPALADNAMLAFLIRQIDAAEGGGLSAHYAACIQGGGDVEKTAAYWTDKGWTRASAGADVTLTSPRAGWTVTLRDGGRACEVSSGTYGTPFATAQLMVAAGMAGFENLGGDCTTMRIAGVRTTITSATSAATCYDEASSTVRMTFDN